MTPIHSVLDTQAAARPEATALVDHDGRRISFADLGAAVAELAAHWLAHAEWADGWDPHAGAAVADFDR